MRLVRLVMWPPSRPLAAVLLWSHRHTIGLWARSIQTEIEAEIAAGSVDPARLKLLGAALWRVSSDPRFRNDPTVRRLTIDSELVEVDRDERRSSLQESLADLPGVVSVEVDGATDDEPTDESRPGSDSAGNGFATNPLNAPLR